MFGFKPIGDGLEPEQRGLSQGLPKRPTLRSGLLVDSYQTETSYYSDPTAPQFCWTKADESALAVGGGSDYFARSRQVRPRGSQRRTHPYCVESDA